MRERSDPRPTMDVDPDVAFRGVRRGSGVHAHPHTDGAPGKRRHCALRGIGCSGRGGERDEERVALCVDLDAARDCERLAEHKAVLGERLSVGIRPERLEQPRRPFDVREQQGDRARR